VPPSTFTLVPPVSGRLFYRARNVVVLKNLLAPSARWPILAIGAIWFGFGLLDLIRGASNPLEVGSTLLIGGALVVLYAAGRSNSAQLGWAAKAGVAVGIVLRVVSSLNEV
jgi:hypothetical protein